MRDQFGATYAENVARDQSLPTLGSRTAMQALNDGEEPRVVWLAVCEHFEIPVAARH
jgi:Protein of unknown function (DUF3046)